MKSFEERLEQESAGWLAEAIITNDQHRRLLARHPVRETGHHRFLSILGSIGGALFAVGVSLVIKSNWEAIGDWVKIGGLVGLLVGCAFAGWRLKLSPGRFPRTGDALLMVAAVFFLLGIALVSQVFHIGGRPANGVLLWWIGIAALPWVTRAKGAQFVSVVAGLLWLTMEFAASDSLLRLTGDAGDFNSDEEFLFAAAGVCTGAALWLSGAGLRAGAREYFAGLHEKLGLLLLCVSLYALSYTWNLHEWSYHAMPAVRWLPVALLGALVLVTAGWAFWKNRAEVQPLAGCLVLGLLPALAHLLSVDMGDGGWLWGGLASVALFLLNLGMIRVGVQSGRAGWINLGIAFIALNIVTRYFLLFGTMLDGGVFFIVTGLLVLGVGYYLERKRRALLKTVRAEVTP